MLPSRGVLRLARIGRQPLLQQRAEIAPSSRKFSSIPQHHAFSRLGKLSRSEASSPSLSSSPHRPTLLLASAALSQQRFNSTSSESSTIANNTTSPSEIVLNQDFNQVATAQAITDTTPWHLGFLNEQLGGFGWGPTSTVQFIFEHLHVYLGSSIGLSIVAAAALIRVVMFPLIMKATDTTTRLRALSPQLNALSKEMKQALEINDRRTAQTLRLKASHLRKANGINLGAAALPLLQIPIGFGSWRLVSNMASLPVLGMTTEGLLWFPNLCIPDPLFLLPLSMGVLQHLTIRFSNTSNQGVGGDMMRSILLWGLPVVGTLVLSWAPAAVQLSFCASAFFSLLTNLVLQTSAFRSTFNIAQKTTSPPPPQASNASKSATKSGSDSSMPVKAFRNYLKGMTVKNAIARARDVESNMKNELNNSTNPFSSYFKTGKERQKETRERILNQREAARETQYQKEMEADLRRIRDYRQQVSQR